MLHTCRCQKHWLTFHKHWTSQELCRQVDQFVTLCNGKCVNSYMSEPPTIRILPYFSAFFRILKLITDEKLKNTDD